MPDPALKTACCAALEKTVNLALRYDPATRQALNNLDGKVLAIESTAPSFSVFIAPCRLRGVQILGSFEGEADTRLRGPLPALLSLAAQPGTTLAHSAVEVSGDAGTLGTMQNVFRNLDIDWEEPLCAVMGDVAGHQTAELIRKALNWTRARSATATRLLGEYLTEELRSLPTRVELQAFYQNVDELRFAADRLQARLDQLRQRVNAS